jgi:hypothetical protein
MMRMCTKKDGRLSLLLSLVIVSPGPTAVEGSYAATLIVELWSP